MIVKLHKYLIYGDLKEMDLFFSLAQRSGFLEFIGLSHKKALELPEDAKTILAAIKIAKGHATGHMEFGMTLPPAEKVAEELLKEHSEHEKLLEEKRVLNGEISRIAPFGNFSSEDLDRLEREGRRVFQFFVLKSDIARDIVLPAEVIYIGTDYDLDYFVAINKEKTQYPKMIEIQIDRPVGELRERLGQIQDELSHVERKIRELSKLLPYLQEGLKHFLNEYHLKLVKNDAALPMDHTLFAIEAWVPDTKIKALHGLLSELDVNCEEIAIESKDVIPTYMENTGSAKIGEDLVHVYDTPAWTDQDPSLWVLIFFYFFYAMIISDAGYGLIYFLLGLFLRWKFKQAAGIAKRLIKMLIGIGVCCMVWGVLTASFFGMQIGPDSPFRKTSFLHYLAVKKADYHIQMKDEVYQEIVQNYPAAATATDGHDFLVKASKVVDHTVKYDVLSEFYDSLLLEFSLLVGVIHITLSFLRYIVRNPVGIGWIIFMFGGYLYFPSILHATSMMNFMGWVPKEIAFPVGKQMLYIGLVLVFVISLLQKKKWLALYELTNSLQLFADVLSYLRLYALALAGMIMADTFNSMGVELGIFGGFFVILIGHTINLSLSTMAGTIHGLRLNFLEWYRYSFEGGGKLFNPLRLRK